MEQPSHTILRFNGKTYMVDQLGFLLVPEQWDEDFAKGLAPRLGIRKGLTEAHWRLIHFVRERYAEKKIPIAPEACSAAGLRFDRFRRLFPTGYLRGALRLAGVDYDIIWNHNHWLTYETSCFPKARYRTTPLGFLLDFEQWDEDFAEDVLREHALSDDLSPEQRSVIGLMRHRYATSHRTPALAEVCRARKITLGQFHRLFPSGYRRGACRMAGLPPYR